MESHLLTTHAMWLFSYALDLLILCTFYIIIAVYRYQIWRLEKNTVSKKISEQVIHSLESMECVVCISVTR